VNTELIPPKPKDSKRKIKILSLNINEPKFSNLLQFY